MQVALLNRVIPWEQNLIDDGVEIIKFYFSLSQDQQKRRMKARKHSEGGEYIEEISGGEMIVADMINPADSPNLTVDQVASDMIDEGAQLIFATSDDMKDGILAAAEKFPDVPMIWASGDSAKVDGKGYRGDLNNLGNIMGKMEYGKMIAKWLVGDVSALLNKDNIEIDESNLSAENFGKLIQRISDSTISGKIAKSVLEEIWKNDVDVDEIIESKGLVQIQDESLLEGIAQKVIDANPNQVNAYKNGKEKLFGFFVGQVMKETQGKANPKTINKILKDL